MRLFLAQNFSSMKMVSVYFQLRPIDQGMVLTDILLKPTGNYSIAVAYDTLVSRWIRNQ
jgi:hypothetical protein